MLDKSYLINQLDLLANQVRQDENGLVYVRGVTADGLREMLIDASASLSEFQDEKSEYLLKLDAVVTAFIERGRKHA